RGRRGPAHRRCVEHRHFGSGGVCGARLSTEPSKHGRPIPPRRPAMTRTLEKKAVKPLWLHAETAADLMMPDPVSIQADANLKEGIALLIDRGFSAAPVIDDAGRPIGVLSRSDIVVHDRERTPGITEFYDRADLVTPAGGRLGAGFHEENVDGTTVGDVMTRAVFAVAPDATAAEVVHEMLALKVHRLFVVDGAGVLVGVISALDVLRHLGT